jgi:hypothetical protein
MPTLPVPANDLGIPASGDAVIENNTSSSAVLRVISPTRSGRAATQEDGPNGDPSIITIDPWNIRHCPLEGTQDEATQRAALVVIGSGTNGNVVIAGD